MFIYKNTKCISERISIHFWAVGNSDNKNCYGLNKVYFNTFHNLKDLSAVINFIR